MGHLIYILEDDENIRELICYTLQTSDFNVICFENHEEFFKSVENKKPDLIILDIMLSNNNNINGLDILKKLKLRDDTNNIPIIFITAKSSEVSKALGLDMGADDYITKPFGVLELVARVKAVLRRYISNIDKQKDKTNFTYKDLYIDLKSKQIFKNNEEIKLTFKEYELFVYLYKNRGIVITRDELFKIVWKDEFFGETRTVDVHIRCLRQKLKDNIDNPIYISTIRGYGYKFIKEN